MPDELCSLTMAQVAFIRSSGSPEDIAREELAKADKIRRQVERLEAKKQKE
ncbi:MAG: hypothetical protein ACYC27_18725 [Armatimonadota bacterium]